MDDRLAVYLHDHLARATFAVELSETLQHGHSGCQTRAFAASLSTEVREDKKIPDGVIVKLSHGQPDGLSTFDALETLNLGIMGKVPFGRALCVNSTESRSISSPLPELRLGMTE
jgi:hypothetical protein